MLLTLLIGELGLTRGWVNVGLEVLSKGTMLFGIGGMYKPRGQMRGEGGFSDGHNT